MLLLYLSSDSSGIRTVKPNFQRNGIHPLILISATDRYAILSSRYVYVIW